MKVLMCVALCLATTLASDYPECASLTEEKMAELKKLVVTDDIHDQIVGDYSVVYGPSFTIEEDEKSCVKVSRQKINDKELSDSVSMKGEGFGGEKTKNGSMEKIENGVYVLKKHNGDAKGKIYTIYAKNNVYAYFMCKLPCTPGASDEKKTEKKPAAFKKTPSWSSVHVRSEDLKTPMDAQVQEAVDEAVKKIQEHKELLGDVVKFPYPC